MNAPLAADLVSILRRYQLGDSSVLGETSMTIVAGQAADMIDRLTSELATMQGIAAERNARNAEFCTQRDEARKDVDRLQAELLEMQARCAAAIWLVPDDKLCGELTQLRDQFKKRLASDVPASRPQPSAFDQSNTGYDGLRDGELNVPAPKCDCRSPGEMYDRDCPVHGQDAGSSDTRG